MKSIDNDAVATKRISLFGPPKVGADAYGVGTGIVLTIAGILNKY